MFLARRFELPVNVDRSRLAASRSAMYAAVTTLVPALRFGHLVRLQCLDYKQFAKGLRKVCERFAKGLK
jgi:hypothetical protein